MTQVRIAPVGTADVEPGLVEPLTAMLGALVRADAALGWTDPPSQQEISDLLHDLAAASPQNACALVAWSDEEVAGFGYWTRYARPTHRPHADLEKLAVSPDFPRLGIGRRLVQDLAARARAAGIEQLTLDFRGDNARAEALYLSEGFVEYGRLVDFVAPADDRRYDMVLHVLNLR